MATDNQLVSEIATELKRTDLTSEIQTAVLDAIAFYERRRWWFNEQNTIQFVTVPNTERYSSTDIGQVVKIDLVQITVSGTQYPVFPRPYQIVKAMNEDSGDVGEPDLYSWYGKKIYFASIPDQSYTVNVSGHIALPLLTFTGAENEWTTLCKDLIKSRAKWDVAANQLKDDVAAAASKQREQEAVDSLTSRNTRSTMSGFVPSRW